MKSCSENRIQQFHKVYLNVAKELASLSRCNRAKVGCIIVKDGNIISFGFNGTPSGACNECEQKGQTNHSVIHAEINAIIKANYNVEGADMYVTLSPCKYCTDVIAAAGIKTIYYSELYRESEHLKLINAIKIESSN